MRLSRPLVAFPVVLAAAISVAALAPAARADIVITIDKTTQQMTVLQDNFLLYAWPVSTGAAVTTRPRASSSRSAWSAITSAASGTTHRCRTRSSSPSRATPSTASMHVKAIGTPASHGCVRLKPENAAILFDLVKQEGMSHTKVVLTGETPEPSAAPVARRNQDKRGRAAVASVGDDDDVAGYVAPPPPRRVHAAPRGWRYPPRYRHYYSGRYYYRGPFPFGW